MLDKIKAFQNNIYLFSLGTYGLGLIYLSLYYYRFDIPIIYYLSLNDMLLLAVTLIIPVVIITYLFEIVFINWLKRIFIKESNAVQERRLIAITIIILLVLVLVFAIFFRYVHIINPSVYFIVLFCSMTIAGKLSVYLDPKKIIFPLVVCFYGLFWGINALVDFAKSGYASKDVKFDYEDKILTTKFYSDLVYVGETSSTIFLYSFANKSTAVFEKSKMSNLIYYDKISNENWYDNQLKVRELENASIKANKDTTTKINQWYKKNENTYVYTVENSPRGISLLMEKLKIVLAENDFDFEIPTEERSFMPDGTKLDKDFKKLNDDILSGNYEVAKWWSHPSGFIMLGLEKGHYYIQFKSNSTTIQNSNNK